MNVTNLASINLATSTPSLRTLTLAFLVAAIAIVVTHFYGTHPVRIRWAVLTAFAAGKPLLQVSQVFLPVLLYELFLRYAELPRP